MKKLTKILMLAAGMLLFASVSTYAQHIYVSVRPTPPVIVRTTAPSPRHIWVGEEWTVRNGVYVHTGGYWALPPHRGMIWVSGHWAHERGGEYWIPGHWRR
jgi:hypothetical protein